MLGPAWGCAMILRALMLFAALGPAWAADFDPASYRSLHYAGEIRHELRDGEIEPSDRIAFCGPLTLEKKPAPESAPARLPSDPPLDPAAAANLHAPGAASPVIPSGNPHDGGKVRYYLNDLAAGIKGLPGQVRFPIGAIIVKEKWQALAAVQPTVITVMEKLGDAADASSWSYRMYDCVTHQDLTVAYLKQASTACMDCHARWESTGFISPRGYALIRTPSP
jgi:hypothetical protein